MPTGLTSLPVGVKGATNSARRGMSFYSGFGAFSTGLANQARSTARLIGYETAAACPGG